MEITIKKLTGQTHLIRCVPSDTVEDVKQKIQDLAGYPVCEQRIILAGRQLNDAETLCQCNVQEESVFHLVLRLRGGKPVILLYPPAPIDATVALELSPLWRFSALYPRLPSNKTKQTSVTGVSLVMTHNP